MSEKALRERNLKALKTIYMDPDIAMEHFERTKDYEILKIFYENGSITIFDLLRFMDEPEMFNFLTLHMTQEDYNVVIAEASKDQIEDFLLQTDFDNSYTLAEACRKNDEELTILVLNCPRINNLELGLEEAIVNCNSRICQMLLDDYRMTRMLSNIFPVACGRCPEVAQMILERNNDLFENPKIYLDAAIDSRRPLLLKKILDHKDVDLSIANRPQGHVSPEISLIFDEERLNYPTFDTKQRFFCLDKKIKELSNIMVRLTIILQKLNAKEETVETTMNRQIVEATFNETRLKLLRLKNLRI